jgi:hypothetical protein
VKAGAGAGVETEGLGGLGRAGKLVQMAHSGLRGLEAQEWPASL